MLSEETPKTWVFRNFVNSFHYLYQDAEYLHKAAQRARTVHSFEETQLCRTALILYILSLEGLVNRACDHFLPEPLRGLFLKSEDRFSLEDKCWLLCAGGTKRSASEIDRSRYPWSHFSEVVQIRNDFVHPKHDRAAYYRAISAHRWEPLPWNEIPKGLGVKEKEVVYRQSRIPKDPYAIGLTHLEEVKRIVNDTVAELDRLLGGRVLSNNWSTNDQMALIYPRTAKLTDLPADPQT